VNTSDAYLFFFSLLVDSRDKKIFAYIYIYNSRVGNVRVSDVFLRGTGIAASVGDDFVE